MIRAKTDAPSGLKVFKNSMNIYRPAPKKMTKMKAQIFLLLGLITLSASCKKKPGSYPPEPQIYYMGAIPRVVNLEDTAAMVKIDLKFTDGDGDIGRDPNEKQENIYLRDSRDTSTSIDYTFKQNFPYLDDSKRPDGGGLEGFMSISLGRQWFSISDSLHLALRKDTLHFDIYIMDDAGHKSNVVSTDPIYIEF